MQRLVWSIFALSALLGSALLAQNIAGTWQGTLKANGPNGPVELRAVMKISRADNENLKGVFYPNIDERGVSVNVTSITLKGSSVKMSITQMNGTFDGTLSGDGNTISGNFKQGGPALPLNLARATAETAWTIPEPPPPPKPMPANADPAFVVATIKPSNPDAQGQGYGFRGQDVTTTNTSVSWLITLAYNMHAHQVVGGPGWLGSEKYDILGRPDTPGQPSRDQLKIMFKKLLADRFQLKFHIEKRELAAYTITVLKTGPKFVVSTADPNSSLGIGFGLAPVGMTLNVRNAPFDSVANALQGNLLDKPVVNQTGLTGKYDFTVKFTPDQSQLANLGPVPPGAAATDPDAAPDIFTAFQQQLGLKLESTKTAVDVMVIEKIEKPSDN